MAEGLVEFLLARFAKDEEVAWVPAGSPRRYGKTIARRMLAECAAKRWMVEQAQSVFDAFRTDPGLSELHWNYTQLLSRFALPYADHPDYRPEWRPR